METVNQCSPARRLRTPLGLRSILESTTFQRRCVRAACRLYTRLAGGRVPTLGGVTSKISNATGTYRFTSWDEKPYAESDGSPKLTRSEVTNVYDGDLTGEGGSQLL